MNIQDIFKRITPSDAIAAELAEAEMQLLKAETGVEYAQSLVDYNKARVKRLKAYLNAEVHVWIGRINKGCHRLF